MIKYHLRQNNNESSAAYGKFYAYPVIEETIDLAGLAKHMEEHNTGFSEAMCIGVLKAMVKCIKEQLLAGKNVKIDDLAIFSVGIRNKEGAESAEVFCTSSNIAGVKLRARATGTLSNANLNLAASIKKAGVVVNSQQSDGNGQQSNNQQSEGNGQQPNANGQQPDANGQQPDANGQQPDTNGQQPNGNGSGSGTSTGDGDRLDG